MSQTHRRYGLTATFCALALVGLARAVIVAEDPLAGAWVMQSYRGVSSVGPSTGQMVFADGRFALVYRMTPDGAAPSGRAHAGTYTLDGSTLLLRVAWSMDHVSGKGSVDDKTTDHKVRADLRGDELTLTFANGGVQVFKRARP